MRAQLDNKQSEEEGSKQNTAVEPVKVNQNKHEIVLTDDVEIGFNRFTTVMSKILHEIGMYRELDDRLYLQFVKKQQRMNLKLPKSPVPYFNSSWEELNDYIKRKFYQKILNKSNAEQVNRIINGEMAPTGNRESFLSENTERSSPRRKKKESIEDVMRNFKELRNKYGDH